MFKLVRNYLPWGGITMLVCGLVMHAVAQEADLGRTPHWPGFRGPNGLGVIADINLPFRFNAKTGENVRWKVALPKPGMSSPVVWSDQVFLTGADEHSRQIYSLNADSGTLQWTHEVQGLEGEPSDGTVPRVLDETGLAAPTPTTNGRHVAAVFATGELVCVDLKGVRVWSKHLGVPKNHYGHASSLLNDGERLFVQFDHKGAPKLYAFDLATGKMEWQVDRKEIGWSSPILIESHDRRQLVLANSKAVDGYDPTTGKLLWHVECLAGEVASSPAFSDGLVVVASEGSTASAIDTTTSDGAVTIRWQWDESLPDASSSVAHNGLVIIPTGFGVVSCLDIKTGTLVWEHQFDTGFSSSPIVVGEKVILADLSGKLQIFKLSKGFERLGECDLGEAIYATPAFVPDRVYIRSIHHLFCLEK